MNRVGDRWSLVETEFAGEPVQSGRAVHDEHGEHGILDFLPTPRSPIHAARLEGMIQTFARIEHANLEPVLDWGTLASRPWIVRPSHPTRMMREWLHEQVSAWGDLLEKFIGIGRAVAELHRHGLVHGALLPEVFVLDSSGSAQIRGTVENLALRLASSRPDQTSLAGDQADLCMAIHGALLAIETALVTEAPKWLIEMLERGFSEKAAEQWPSIDALIDPIEHRLRMRSRLVVLRGGAAA